MIQKRCFLPELSHIDESGEFPVFVTLDGRIGCVFEVPILDLEATDASNLISSVEALTSALPENVLLRVIQKSEVEKEIPFPSFRSQAVRQLGFVQRSLLLSIEKEGKDPFQIQSLLSWFREKRNVLQAEVLTFQSTLPRSELKALRAVPLLSSEIQSLFQKPVSQVEKRENSLDFGTHLTGVIRLYKQGNHPIGETTLLSFLDKIPLPYEVSVTASKVSKTATDFKLRSLLSQQMALSDSTTRSKMASTEKALEETSLQGISHCEMEWILILNRRDERTLRSDLESALSSLRSLGEVMIETHGAVPSYVATRIGAKPHFTFTETDQVVPLYFPVFSLGEAFSKKEQKKPHPKTLLLHRKDGSLHFFDLFNPKFLAFNVIITGKTGSGKSVLANALSSSLLQDENCVMIKVDVGGSYRKECELYQGSEVTFSLDTPSGINPFSIFKEVKNSNEAISTLTEFLSILIREEKEIQIPKMMKAQVESSLKRYSEFLTSYETLTNPSLDQLIQTTPEFPRKELLERWMKGGVFENALQESHLRSSQNRYRYYNALVVLGDAGSFIFSPDFAL